MAQIALLIAGAAKAGTTSLLYYLGQHPGVCVHRQREMAYFANESIFHQGFERALARYYDCEPGRRPLLFAKSVMVLYLPAAMARLKAHSPDVQLVLSLRHPVERAYSDYWYARRRGWEDAPTFEAALAADPTRFGADELRRLSCAYLLRSSYAVHLQNLFACFRREQVQVFLLEEIQSDPAAVCHQIFGRFASLDDRFTPRFDHQRNRAALPRSRSLATIAASGRGFPLAKRLARRLLSDGLVDKARDALQRFNEKDFTPPPMKPETRSQLLDYFRPLNEQLSELIGRDVSPWNEAKL